MPLTGGRRTILLRFFLAGAFFTISATCLYFSARPQVSATRTPSSRQRETPAVAGPINGHIISQGEDLLYEVSWSVFKIGTVRLKTLQTRTENNIPYYTAAAFIDSYEGLPFVNLHAIVYTEMDSTFTSYSCRSLERKNDEWWGMSYRFDSALRNCYVEETWQKDLTVSPYKRQTRDTIAITGTNVQDGLSLLYFARSRAHRQHTTISVPIIAYGKAGSVDFQFGTSLGEESIKALDRPVRVEGFDGILDIEGLFGLTGEFKGWVSNDPAAIPIKAKMKVILGSINLELIEWRRSGWEPPR